MKSKVWLVFKEKRGRCDPDQMRENVKNDVSRERLRIKMRCDFSPCWLRFLYEKSIAVIYAQRKREKRALCVERMRMGLLFLNYFCAASDWAKFSARIRMEIHFFAWPLRGNCRVMAGGSANFKRIFLQPANKYKKRRGANHARCDLSMGHTR